MRNGTATIRCSTARLSDKDVLAVELDTIRLSCGLSLLVARQSATLHR